MLLKTPIMLAALALAGGAAALAQGTPPARNANQAGNAADA